MDWQLFGEDTREKGVAKEVQSAMTNNNYTYIYYRIAKSSIDTIYYICGKIL